IGDGSLDAVAVDRRFDVFVKVRSTRPPHPAWLIRGGEGVEGGLGGGGEGGAPGQACAFYDAGRGEAGMLGGGFIGSAAPRREIDGVAAVRPAPTLPSPACGGG